MASDWSSIAFRDALCAMVRRRVPERDVEDVVQSTLVEALASKSRPDDPESVRKWIWGIARNKVADYHRRAKRESLEVPDSLPAPTSDRGAADDLLRWAVRELPKEGDAQKTLEWLLREGDGDKLEAIAESENLPAPRVRQRVSRLRRHLRTRWAADLAMLAALGVAVTLLVVWWRRSKEEPVARPDESVLPHAPTPFEQAADERKRALAACDALQWQPCLDGLDRAKTLDPAGDAAENVQNARKLAEDALHPPPAPTPSFAPTTDLMPTAVPTSVGPTDSKINGTKSSAKPVPTPTPQSTSIAKPSGKSMTSDFSDSSSGGGTSLSPFASSIDPTSSSSPPPKQPRGKK